MEERRKRGRDEEEERKDRSPKKEEEDKKPKIVRERKPKDEDEENLPLAPQSNNTKLGQPCALLCNHFLWSLNKREIYQFHVDFKPDVESFINRRRYIYKYAVSYIGKHYIFDGALLFTFNPINAEFPLTIVTQEPSPFDPQEFVKITINKVKTIQNSNRGGEVPQQLYNMVFKKIFKMMGLKEISRRHYNPKQSIEVKQHKLELWPGYATSIRFTDSGYTLAADISHKILRRENVYDLIEEFKRRSRRPNEEANSEISRKTVLTKYGNRDRTYRIDGVAWQLSPLSTFRWMDKSQQKERAISYRDYYQSAYNIKLQFDNQPLLRILNKKRDSSGREVESEIFLVPELCFLTGLSETMRNDFRVMKDLSAHTQVTPVDRVQRLEEFSKQINENKTIRAELDEWNVSLDTRLLRLEGRILGPETIVFDQFEQRLDDTASWGRLNNKRFLSPVSLSNWLMVFSEKDYQQAQKFVETLQKVGQPCGMRFGPANMCKLKGNHPKDFIEEIKHQLTRETQLVVCLLPDKRKERYEEIKHLCYVRYAVASQCVVASTLQRNMMSVVTKIMFQINCKLGGELWKVAINPPLPKVMIIGIDVSHNVGKGSRSVAGFCATINDNLTKYFSRIIFQKSKQELTSGLTVCMHDALKVYHKYNNALPNFIIVYRDGVGDGQMKAVRELEIPQLDEAIRSYNNYNPKMTVLIVKKRIHTKLIYLAKRGAQTNLANPIPGTVVDSGCTFPNWYDFYLVAQSARQGTVSPTHYVVLRDDIRLKPDWLQHLTFKLCHLFFNWPGTVRSPAPCVYAHKLALFVSEALHEVPNPGLDQTLFFL